LKFNRIFDAFFTGWYMRVNARIFGEPSTHAVTLELGWEKLEAPWRPDLIALKGALLKVLQVLKSS
jgi:hypothetical protein